MNRLSLCFCILTLILAQFSLAAQEKMKLLTAFDLIEEQSGYAVAYNEEHININRKVVLPIGNNLEDTLKALLKGTGMKAIIQGKRLSALSTFMTMIRKL